MSSRRDERGWRGWRPVFFAVALLALSRPAAAQGRGAFGVSEEGGIIGVTASFTEAGSNGTAVDVTGTCDLPDGVVAKLYFSNALEFEPLQEQQVAFQGGRIVFRFGPYAGLAPGNYLVRAAFTPWEQQEPLKEDLKKAGKESLAKGEIVFAYKTSQTPRQQKAAHTGEVNARVRNLRTLFVELERNVGEYRKEFARSHDSTKAQTWYQDWRIRALAMQESWKQRADALGFGAPFKPQVSGLAWLANRLVYYGDRLVIRITGDEKLDPEDEGRTMESLAQRGKLPSGMVRSQLFEALHALSSLTAYADPNLEDVAHARPRFLSAFAALARTYHSMRTVSDEPKDKPPTPAEWESALELYRRLKSEGEQLCRDAMFFCEKRSDRRTEEELQGADAAAALLEFRDKMDALAAFLGKALAEKKELSEVQPKIDAVLTAAFRPELARALQSFRDTMQFARANFNSLIGREARVKTGFVEALAEVDGERLAPVRKGLADLDAALQPLDGRARVVSHYVRTVELAKTICDRIREFAADARTRYSEFGGANRTHPMVAEIDKSLAELEQSLSPPPEGGEPPK